MYLEVNGQTYALTDDGFLQEREHWTPNLANALAEHAQINLTEQHWLIINSLRAFYQRTHRIPPLRIFIKQIKQEFGDELGNSIKLHQLFAESPMKKMCKIAGLPKPRHCM